jgi:xanthosine phosphorylase
MPTTPRLRELVKATVAAKEKGIALHEGVYLSPAGPELRDRRRNPRLPTMGADVVGMSVVPEVISARHCGLKVAGVSAITNLAEGLSPFPLSHEQTLKYAAIGAKDLVTLIHSFIPGRYRGLKTFAPRVNLVVPAKAGTQVCF